jgi:myo-inositol 2-dehydrogenase/D-chiro-inositol 1-dehydrogenase
VDTRHGRGARRSSHWLDVAPSGSNRRDVDVDISRAKQAAQTVPSAVAFADIREALSLRNVNAVLIATPGFLHEEAVAQIGERDVPILCEKPLTLDAASSWRIVEAEQRFGKKRIQVGFMRRFDIEYLRLQSLIGSAELGNLLMLHCAHRNPEVPPEFTNEMLISDSVAHEFDIIRGVKPLMSISRSVQRLTT